MESKWYHVYGRRLQKQVYQIPVYKHQGLLILNEYFHNTHNAE